MWAYLQKQNKEKLPIFLSRCALLLLPKNYFYLLVEKCGGYHHYSLPHKHLLFISQNIQHGDNSMRATP